MQERTVYLDNNATTQVSPEVRDVMVPFFCELYGNPSSMHAFGGKIARYLERAREEAARFINASPDEIIFTSCATESDNTAIRGVADMVGSSLKVATTAVEHPAVLQPVRRLKALGHEIVAADPFAVPLKDQIVAFLKERGYDVTDYSKTQGQDRPYFDSAVAVCEAMQAGAAPRALLFCGTGMGMSIVANRFRGVTAAVVESVFAAKMCRAINDANVLCLGQMIWGTEMAKAAVEAFLNTKFTEGLEGLSGFLHDACKKVEAIRP